MKSNLQVSPLQKRLERAGYAVAQQSERVWRLQVPHYPEIGAYGETLEQAAHRLARSLRARSEDIDTMLAGYDP